jgi:hypothetical protein
MSTPIHSHVQLYVCKVFVDGVVDGQVVVNFLVLWMVVANGVFNLLEEHISSWTIITNLFLYDYYYSCVVLFHVLSCCYFYYFATQKL